MKNTIISPIQKNRIEETSRLLGKAYAANPGHVALFGQGNFVSNERFFSFIMNNFTGEIFTAISEGVIVGVLCFIKHPQPVSLTSKPAQLTPELLLTSQSAITRIQEWMSEWGRLDPKESHYHLGPIAVLPEYQHGGIGSQMMEYFCQTLDLEGEMGYLETDSIENVKFYTRFKFQVINKLTVSGMPNWFMKRDPLSK